MRRLLVAVVLVTSACGTTEAAAPPQPTGEPFLPAYIKMLTDPPQGDACPGLIIAPCDK